jgi:hypothetical protein
MSFVGVCLICDQKVQSGELYSHTTQKHKQESQHFCLLCESCSSEKCQQHYHAFSCCSRWFESKTQHRETCDYWKKTFAVPT